MGSAAKASNKRVGLRVIASVLALLVVGLAVGVIVLLQQTQQPPIALGAPSGELSYTSNAAGDWDIYTLDSSGQPRRLTSEGSGDDYFASWSFEGDMINFLTDRSGDMGPGQVNPDGTGLRTLGIAQAITSLFFEGRLDWDPAWTAADVDGTVRVLWASLRDLNLEVYVRAGNSAEPVRLTEGGARDWFMAWSPDGTRILFSSDREGNENIYLMNADGSDLVQLTDDPMDDLHPVWSLDGQRILFVSERAFDLVDGQLDLYVMNLDGSDQRRLDVGEIFRGDPTYTADGAQVAYISNEAGDWNIYLTETDNLETLDTARIRRLTESDADDLFPVWRPVPANDAGE